MLTDYRIEKAVINQLPLIEFEGEIIIVEERAHLNDVCEKLMDETLLGFDTESKPSFRKGQNFPVSVIQFSTMEKTYLIRNRFTGITDPLRRLMNAKTPKKLGIALKDDLKKLHEFGATATDGFVDLSSIARHKGILQTGAKSLAARYLEHRISKSMQTSNWALKKLSEKQMRYAATDSWINLMIYDKLLADNTDYHAMRVKLEEQSGNTETANR